MRNAKLSEYKFLAILRGFADEKTPKELALTARVSEKTIRSLYKLLRQRLILAVTLKPDQFGHAGYFLFEAGQISKRGETYLNIVLNSESFKRYSKHHMPRNKAPDRTLAILIELGIRSFCRMAKNKNTKITYSDHAKQTIKNWKFLASWFEKHKDDQSFLTEHADLYHRYQKSQKDMKDFLRLEQLLSITNQSTKHRYANDVLYNDLRRYLLKNPLEPLTTHN